MENQQNEQLKKQFEKLEGMRALTREMHEQAKKDGSVFIRHDPARCKENELVFLFNKVEEVLPIEVISARLKEITARMNKKNE